MKRINKIITSPDCYLTGYTALNIFSGETTGDWHFYNNFEAPGIFYDAGPLPSNPWGNKGVNEVSAQLNRQGVYSDNPDSELIYAANHYRAMADLFLWTCQTGTNNFRSLTHNTHAFFDNIEQKQKLFGYLRVLDNELLNNWMDSVKQ